MQRHADVSSVCLPRSEDLLEDRPVTHTVFPRNRVVSQCFSIYELHGKSGLRCGGLTVGQVNVGPEFPEAAQGWPAVSAVGGCTEGCWVVFDSANKFVGRRWFCCSGFPLDCVWGRLWFCSLVVGLPVVWSNRSQAVILVKLGLWLWSTSSALWCSGMKQFSGG